ncbi:hypothetical protein OEZ86_009735 [Tetradesmus obliquus]|uniref:Uncharacterized protein n=1 Tax=Tetradesmus obliquus TaxID=3088 RepID=A0ABY8UNF1_TETOB|nr:hypothetical protein OEZ85_001178 [Tetradesmus obliquus]WIA43229.1 hypothetical protein OEZ86_009735 [Tetradesmus obliquus]
MQQLQHAPSQLLELGFYLQYGDGRLDSLDLRHLTRLTSLISGTELGLRLREDDKLPASLQELTVADCDSVQPLAPLRQLQKLTVDYANAQLAQHIAKLRCKLYSSAVKSTKAKSGASSSSSGRKERCLPKLASLQLCGSCYASDKALTPEIVDSWLALQPALQWLEELRLCSFKTAKKYLDSNEIEPLAAAVAGLPRLRSLALETKQQNSSSSSSREACRRTKQAACSKLQRLGLSDNKHVTDAALPALAQLLPGLTYLDLMSTRVADGGMPFLQALTQLQELMLDGTKVCLQEKQWALRLPVQRESWEERIDNPIVA